MNCPHCGEPIEVPEDTRIVVCPKCQAVIEVNEEPEWPAE
jgi:DNA-directed RNA polymerase subunit RPC12/RpoP